MEEADSAVAVAAVSVEVASVMVFAACLLHAVAARLSDRVHLVATGLTGIPDPEACGPAFATVQEERWVSGGRRAPLTLLRGAAMAPDRPPRLQGLDPKLMEPGGNRSAEVVGLLLGAVQQGAPLRQTRWKEGTPYPRPPLFQGSIAHSGFRTSAIVAPD